MNEKEMRKELAALAQTVLELKRDVNPRRPIVIEFCGSPKSGKTSCINALDLFLRRNKFRTRVLTERASVCPVKNKLDPNFNIWTIMSALAELSEVIANKSKDYDVVILDRGVFDALTWFSWLQKESHLDNDTFRILKNFLSMRRWRNIIDLVYIFTATPEESLKREFSDLMTHKTGSIMNKDVLRSYIKVLTSAKRSFQKNFKHVSLMDTTEMGLAQVNYNVTADILRSLRDSTSERIGYVDRSFLLPRKNSKFKEEKILRSKNALKFLPRDQVENDKTKVQPIPILVITNPERNRVLVVKKNKKSTSKNSPERQKTLLYVGGHMREEDAFGKESKGVMETVKQALAREVKEEIGYDYFPSASEQKESFAIWIRDGSKSEEHIAICHVIERDIDQMKILLDKNEFEKGKSSGIFESVDKIANSPNLESWSKQILGNVFNIQKQTDLSF